MDLSEFKLKNLGIDKNQFGEIFSFVDFGNVNYWFEQDERDGDDNVLAVGDKLVIGLEKLASFLNLFSIHRRFYFGLDSRNKKSYHLNIKAKSFFEFAGSKPIQKIKHYLSDAELPTTTRSLYEDLSGKYILIPKCNFDVEISVDAIRLLEKYDTFCLFSSDVDFTALIRFLKKKGKKIILFSAGHVSHWLIDELTKGRDLNINAQKIKKDITFIKNKPRL